MPFGETRESKKRNRYNSGKDTRKMPLPKTVGKKKGGKAEIKITWRGMISVIRLRLKSIKR